LIKYFGSEIPKKSIYVVKFTFFRYHLLGKHYVILGNELSALTLGGLIDENTVTKGIATANYWHFVGIRNDRGVIYAAITIYIARWKPKNRQGPDH